MDYVYKRPEYKCGLGNVLIHLTSLPEECKLLHENVYKYELSNCMVLNGFTKVSYEGRDPPVSVYINDYTVRFVHSRMRDFLRPTPHMKELIAKHAHLLDGVVAGCSIRHGCYKSDSTRYNNCELKKDPEQFFCSESGLNKFRDIIREAKGRVFVSTDSQSTLHELIEEFGDKITYIDMPYTCTGADDGPESSIEDRQKVYLKWFLLSMCPYLHLTGGERGKEIGGFSTFAYTAAIYGGMSFSCVNNN
jgi:hypothetical protein